MFQTKGSNIIAVDGSTTFGTSDGTHSFLSTGVFYVGSFEIKSVNTRSKTTTKCYVALFMCMATKATHLKLVSNLTPEAFVTT
jgi:hypothetical protein